MPERMKFVMENYRFHRCTDEQCKSIYSGGLKACHEVRGLVKKKDMKCEKCAGIECPKHRDPEYLVKKCEFCCKKAKFTCYADKT